MLTRFQMAHPKISIELVMLDRSVNPTEEGFDLAIGALPTSYPGVIDEPLCPYPRVICASPAYLERCGAPDHPRDLVQHDCSRPSRPPDRVGRFRKPSRLDQC